MTTATMNLTDFLLARIAEDEAAAHRFDADLAREFGTPAESLLSSELTLAGSGYMDYPVLTVDSTRVLAECEAKRRIVDEHAMWQPTGYRYTNGKQIDVCSVDEQHFPCRTLRLLALPYADHPDYREEWRP